MPHSYLGIEAAVDAIGFDVPEHFTPRGRWKNGPLHTFVDDYRQEFFWRRPEEGLLIALAAETITAPDFSVFEQDPQPFKDYQAWRSVLIATYWQQHGVQVLPVVSFGTPLERWVRPGSTWAVRGPAKANHDLFIQRLQEWSERVFPARLVVFGNPVPQGSIAAEILSRPLFSSMCRTAHKEGHHGRT